MKFSGKLYQGETLIDACVLGDVQIIKRKPHSNEYDGSGHLETSKSLPAGNADIAMDAMKGKFVLAFDAPKYGAPDSILINLTIVMEPERTQADFNIDYIDE